jgi:hypothetical protein
MGPTDATRGIRARTKRASAQVVSIRSTKRMPREAVNVASTDANVATVAGS